MTIEVSAQTVVELTPEKAWQLLRDLSLAHNYVPGIIDTRMTTEKREGVGASRKVYRSETGAIDETVVEWNEGYGFLIRLHCGDAGPPFPFREAHFRYAIESEGEHTRLTTSLAYEMRWGAIGRLLDKVLLRRIVGARIRNVALSQKMFFESSDAVTPEQLKRAKAGTRGGTNPELVIPDPDRESRGGRQGDRTQRVGFRDSSGETPDLR